jgi:hypothetical protein
VSLSNGRLAAWRASLSLSLYLSSLTTSWAPRRPPVATTTTRNLRVCDPAARPGGAYDDVVAAGGREVGVGMGAAVVVPATRSNTCGICSGAQLWASTSHHDGLQGSTAVDRDSTSPCPPSSLSVFPPPSPFPAWTLSERAAARRRDMYFACFACVLWLLCHIAPAMPKPRPPICGGGGPANAPRLLHCEQQQQWDERGPARCVVSCSICNPPPRCSCHGLRPYTSRSHRQPAAASLGYAVMELAV